MSHGGNVWQGADPAVWQDHSANIRPDGAPEWVRLAILKGMENVSYYPEPDGLRAARGIAEYLGVDANQVIATAGGISAIDMAMAQNAAGILLLTPCFNEYARQAECHDQDIRRVSIMKHDGSFDLSLAYEALFEGCCVWLCNPMNPSGKAFPQTDILELLQRIRMLHGSLYIDEAFIDYCREYSLVDMIDEYPELVITGSMTKSLGIPGVRLGYICGQPQILDRMKIYRRPWEINCFAEAVAMELPKHRAEIEADARLNAERREWLRVALEALGIRVYESSADFLLCDMRTDARFIAEELHKNGILVRECMDYDTINDGRHLRLAVKTETENKKLVEEIGRILACAENR